MLITNNNIELRNLQEQVEKNKQDIAHHYEIDRTLSNFGIKIVGTVATVNDLPNPLYYEGEYGDGYAVGQAGSYTYYIFTRPDPNAGIHENHWLDVGQLAIQGPQGPVGPQGPRGETGQSTKWFTNQLAADENAQPCDLLLERNGDVFQYNGDLNQWVLITNIKGAQGVQGPRGLQGEQGPQGIKGEKGDTGDAGGFIFIRGILANSTQLPLPSTINDTTAAYLVGSTDPYTLWIQVGENSDTAVWEDMGLFNVATAVTVGGQYRSTWNADTKLDKVTTKQILYGTDAKGEAFNWKFESTASPNSVMFRNTQGKSQISTPTAEDPVTSITNREYVDEISSSKVDKVTTKQILYGTDAKGEAFNWKFESTASPNSVMFRNTQGKSQISTPTAEDPVTSITNREYVDDGLSEKLDKLDPTTLSERMSAYVVDPLSTRKSLAIEDKTQCRKQNIVTYRYPTEAAGTEPVGGGVLITSTPTKDYHCANKGYVDAQKVRKHLVSFENEFGSIAGDTQFEILSTKPTALTWDDIYQGLSGFSIYLKSIYFQNTNTFMINNLENGNVVTTFYTKAGYPNIHDTVVEI